MPELPEVETIRRALAPVLTGRTIVDAWTFGTPKFAAAVDVVGARIGTVGRRGKYLLIDLDDDRRLVVHLGMTGVLRTRGVDAPADPYLRASWTLHDGVVVELQDVRRFGRIAVIPIDDPSSLPTLAALGPEPDDPAFDGRHLYAATARHERAIKTQLLSQRPVAGVGNIYADEALWRARVHPAARRLTRPQATRLADAIRAVITEAIEHRGTTLRDYRTFDGGTGEHQGRLQAYGRAGAPCDRCGRELRAITLDARTTTYCPKCQRA
jgi:formamidopyrimidine-DNA glycosylase